MTEALIQNLRSFLSEKAKRRHVRGRIVDPLPGFNEILFSEFRRLLPSGEWEAEDIDLVLEKLKCAGYITKVEGVIIHLSKEKLLKDRTLY